MIDTPEIVKLTLIWTWFWDANSIIQLPGFVEGSEHISVDNLVTHVTQVTE